MNELVAACFLFLHSYGIEPMDSVKQPIVTIHPAKELEVMMGKVAGGACLDGHIYISDAIDLKTIKGQSVLCHEVAHYTQGYCPVAKDLLGWEFEEKKAYRLQSQFLIDHGLPAIRNEFNPYGEGYTRPRDKISDRGYNGTVEPKPFEESAEVIKKRFKLIEGNHERRSRRGFHARFEDETLDELTIKEYNTHTR